MDNGPDSISEKLKLWCEEQGIRLLFIQPWNLVQNDLSNATMDQLEKNFLMPICFLLEDLSMLAEE
jgi:hypothetical protein